MDHGCRLFHNIFWFINKKIVRKFHMYVVMNMQSPKKPGLEI